MQARVHVRTYARTQVRTYIEVRTYVGSARRAQFVHAPINHWGTYVRTVRAYVAWTWCVVQESSISGKNMHADYVRTYVRRICQVRQVCQLRPVA